MYHPLTGAMPSNSSSNLTGEIMILRKRFTRFVFSIAAGVLITIVSGSIHAEEHDPGAIIKQMSEAIAKLDKFIVTGDGYVDARLDAGQIIEHSMDVTLRVNRPKAMRVTNRDAESTKEIYFEDGVLTIYTSDRNFYAQTEIPAGADEAARYAVNELGIDAPMLDFLFNDVAAHLLEDAEAMEYLGLSLFREKTYHHIGIRTDELDLQLWIAAEGTPLPGKMVISMKWEAGSPRSVFFLSWDTQPDWGSKTFRFDPPAGSTRIEFDPDSNDEGAE
jgi:hypothetical protein